MIGGISKGLSDRKPETLRNDLANPVNGRECGDFLRFRTSCLIFSAEKSISQILSRSSPGENVRPRALFRPLVYQKPGTSSQALWFRHCPWEWADAMDDVRGPSNDNVPQKRRYMVSDGILPKRPGVVPPKNPLRHPSQDPLARCRQTSLHFSEVLRKIKNSKQYGI